MPRLTPPKHWTIQTKLTISFCLVLLISNGVITYLYYNHSVDQIYDKLSQSTHKTVLQVNKTLDFYIRDMERLSLSVFADPVVQRVLRDPADNEVRQMQYNSDVELRLLNLSMVWPDIVGIYIYSLEGHIYYQTKGVTPALGFTIQQEPWYDMVKQNKEEKIFLIPTSWESHTYIAQNQVISLVRRISDTTVSRELGYMKIDLSLSALDDLVSDVQTDDVGRVIILSSDNRTLFDTKHKQPVDLAGEPFVGKISSEESGQFTYTVDGVPQLVVFNRSAYSGWKVAAMLPISTLNKENKQVRNSVLMLAAAMIGLASLFAYGIAKNLTRRIRRLKRMMVKAERGQFDATVEDSSFDEVGNLTRSFNTMLRSIDELIRENYILQLKETESQMMALQAQINPHFLYNTLNVMRSISNHYEATDVSRMIEVLSDMFRYSIIKDQGDVELREELEQVKRYMYIQNIRFEHQFELELDVPESLLASPIVRQTLQPIVENSVTHGLEALDKPGKLLIQARREQDTLIVRIQDNGIGIEPMQLAEIRRSLSDSRAAMNRNLSDRSAKGTGLGLGNVHQRLRLRFGKEYGLSIDSVWDQGTIVSLRMPCRD